MVGPFCRAWFSGTDTQVDNLGWATMCNKERIKRSPIRSETIKRVGLKVRGDVKVESKL